MSPTLILVILAAMLLAMLPVWRLRVAGWRPGVLFWAWVVYAVALVVVLRFPGPARFLVPILVLAFVAPFVAGPERLTRLFGPRTPPARPIIDVSPKPGPELPEPPRNVTPDDDEDGGGIG
ncbi:MAG TPA: hypothetical protein VES19_09575 [Candidatus Limnocylindrales bacterium]|nr:hypothetical protein [Candidatus Limnocylindrales bacterium]